MDSFTNEVELTVLKPLLAAETMRLHQQEKIPIIY